MAPSNQPAATSQANQAQVELSQPTAKQSMTPIAPSEAVKQQDQEREEVRLRGGEACPGRFCFIIPCPLPCNFCVFPCPC